MKVLSKFLPDQINNRIKDFTLFSNDLKNLPLSDKTLIQTLNQYSYCLTKEDSEFRDSLLGSDVLLPDGIAIVLAIWLTTGKKIKKIAGADLHQHLLEELNLKSGKCFYLGSTENTLHAIKSRCKKNFPNIQVEYYSPPFKNSFTDFETEQMIMAVNAFQPDVLFIGMTAPKQEKWAFANKEFLEAPIICCVGAVFDFYAGNIERPSKAWINLEMEWLVRFAREPRRMWIRYGYYGPLFFKDLILELLTRIIRIKPEEGRFKSIKEITEKMN